jgi:hypothetical protein
MHRVSVVARHAAIADDDRLMVSRRLDGIPEFGIDRVADAAGSDPEVLRLENYDTEIPPHPGAVEVTRAANEPVERLASLGDRLRAALT